MNESTVENPASGPVRRILRRWQAIPLYLRILIALVLGALTGMTLGPRAAALALPARIILKLLGALAPPLVLVAVVQGLMNTRVGPGVAGKLAALLLLNTLVAIGFGLLAANLVRPGKRATISPPPQAAASSQPGKGPLIQFIDSIPDSLLQPLVDNNVLGVIMIGIAFGIALRPERDVAIRNAQDLVELAYRCIVRVLHWVIALVPLGVFGIVAGIVGKEGFGPFRVLGWFILTVLLGLTLQATWYLARIGLFTKIRPLAAVRGTRDAMAMAFSTDSSTATMPVTYTCLVKNVGLRPAAANLGALVGTNFNNDGTALYEAASALFISQMLGHSLTLSQQVMIVLTSVVASVGAAGIPEAGLVTMTLVFQAVGLPVSYIAILLTVDWFLDRCRTVVNVMGDINVSCMLDAKLETAGDPQQQ